MTHVTRKREIFHALVKDARPGRSCSTARGIADAPARQGNVARMGSCGVCGTQTLCLGSVRVPVFRSRGRIRPVSTTKPFADIGEHRVIRHTINFRPRASGFERCALAGAGAPPSEKLR